jgi:hypothetical protein
MGMQRRVNHQRKHQWEDSPSSIRLIACVLCHTAAGQKFTSPIKKIKIPELSVAEQKNDKKDKKPVEDTYYHMKGCPRTA